MLHIATSSYAGKKMLARTTKPAHLMGDIPMKKTLVASLTNHFITAKKRHAFTLIELLIVIAIIGILMALLFPAISAAIDTARRTQAQNDVVQIANAVVAYETEYGKLPPAGSDNVDKGFVEMLAGMTTTNNPRRIVFLEVQAAKRGKSGTNSSGDFVDPWGGAYKIALDVDYDNTITAGKSPGESVRKKVGVWNDTSTHTNATDAQKNRRYVKSW